MKTLLLLVILPTLVLTCDQAGFAPAAPKFTAPVLSSAAPVAAAKTPAPAPARPDAKCKPRDATPRPAHLFM